ncbi:DUF1513 domain-containing protein [Halomonas piscis]|uniref:DUF1513 domain-containing protein n=1 Tax=Halomonas piscis TaxID=3031727 RepID=A0ABY9Z0T2_9GAMM|nr:DUF1513 domain-containing protein [Halomonas piscis]WNK19828.1 DUF1513 domain-containing protein [Halomonas piscis]
MTVNRTRRRLLAAGAGALALPALPSLAWALPGRKHADWLFSAVDDARGNHRIAAITPNGEQHFTLAIPERCHGGCLSPTAPRAVVFARRPGQHFYVVDGDRREVSHRVAAGGGHHFYGHGVFAPDGRYLYVTANRLEDAMGLVRVYDAEDDYRHVRDIELDGIGPHEIRLMPDGETLAVGLGGIRTHPDYGRVKLNLGDMDPALLLVDRESGDVTARHRPSHHQLSCRHLDVAEDGTVIAGYQFQGPEWETRPLLCRLGPDGAFSELALDEALTASLQQYTASVAVSRRRPLALVTAPRGHKVLLLNHQSGKLVAEYALADAAGARCDGEGGFVVSSGRGGLYRIAPNKPEALALASLPLRWDNHLT